MYRWGRRNVHAKEDARSASSIAACQRISATGESARAPIAESLTTCETPAVARELEHPQVLRRPARGCRGR